MKYYKTLLIVTLLIFIITSAACTKEPDDAVSTNPNNIVSENPNDTVSEKNDDAISGKAENNFDGYGNLPANMSGTVCGCEGDETILFKYGALLMQLDKTTGQVSLLCKDPACKHVLEEDDDCLSARFACNIQYFNNNFYFFDISNGCYCKYDGSSIKTIAKIGSPEIYGAARLYNGNFYYSVRNEDELDDIIISDIDNNLIRRLNIGEHISSNWIYGDYCYYTTMEYQLYRIGIDGNNKELLTDKKVNDIIPHDGYLYYTVLGSTDAGLYRMDIESSNIDLIYPKDIHTFSLSDEYIYVNVNSFDEKGFYIMKPDGTEVNKISDKNIYVSTFSNYDKVIGIDDSTSYFDGSNMVIMDKDGSNLSKLDLPVHFS